MDLFAQVDPQTAASWWEIAQAIGAGGLFVAVPAAIALWRALEREREYNRETDRETLAVCQELTTLLRELRTAGNEGIKKLEERIDNVSSDIREGKRAGPD